jgi:hypothetical protein
LEVFGFSAGRQGSVSREGSGKLGGGTTLAIKDFIERLKQLTGRAQAPAPATPPPPPKGSAKREGPAKREPVKVQIIGPEEQMAFNQEDIARTLAAVETGKALLSHSDPQEVERGRRIIEHHSGLTPKAYGIGQIKWRLGLGDPSDDLEAAVKHYAVMLQECEQYGLETNVYWAHLVSFVCVILSGAIPGWVAKTLPDQSAYADRRKRLTPWEINLGYQFALAQALHEGHLPAYWPRFLGDSAERAGLKRIRQNIVTYEKLFAAAQQRNWDELVTAVGEVDANYRKRGSSEAGYADVFGDGPYNSRSIDFIAAAILRTVQNEAGFPRERLSTPHLWKWGTRDLSHLAPKV